jgi:hypothetical protein
MVGASRRPEMIGIVGGSASGLLLRGRFSRGIQMVTSGNVYFLGSSCSLDFDGESLL